MTEQDAVVSPDLTDAQVRRLGSLRPRHTMLSPFVFVPDGDDAPLPGELLGSDGALAPAWEPIVDVLACPDRSGAVRYVGPEGVAQAMTVSRTGSDTTVLVRPKVSGTEISTPPLIADVMLMLREAFGGALTGPGELHVDLSPTEAIAFVAVIDALRHRSLRILAGDVAAGPSVVSQDEAFAATSGGSVTTDLAPMLSGSIGDDRLSITEFGVALRDLTGRGLVELPGTDVRLGPIAPDLVGTLLVPSGRFQLRAALTGPDDTDLVTELDGVTGAGPGALLWSAVGDSVTLQTLTAAVLLELTRRVLIAPELVVLGAAALDGGVADAVTCPACGHQPRPDDRFCVSCGVRLPGR